MNLIPKAVFSDTLHVALWGQTQIIRGDLVEGISYLKAQDGKDIYAHGGAGFARALIAANLIDEYHLVSHPVAIGGGLTIFSGIAQDRTLELLESKNFAKGAVVNIYRPVRE
jgi:dihydrofolate reductase